MDNSEQIRLNKFLAERLGVSRREADELISAGKVTIDGKVAALGARILTSDGRRGRVTSSEGVPRESRAGEEATAGPAQRPVIRCNGKVVPYDTDYIYLAFHKPVGYVCSRRAQGSAPTLYELLPKKYHHLKTVGRLDKDSSGLILLTNNGDFAFQMTHPKFRKTKVYEIELDKPLEPLHQQMISEFGVLLDDGPSKFKIIKDDSAQPSFSGRVRPARRPCRVVRVPRGGRHGRPALLLGLPASGPPSKEIEHYRYKAFLSEGRNRQIRRTFASLGYKVVKLHRVQFGKYELGSLDSGKYVIIKP